MRLSFIGSVNYEAMAAGVRRTGHGKDTSDHGYHGICLRRMDHGVRFAGLADFSPSPVLR